MGHSFSVPKLKVALKTAVARMAMASNKRTNQAAIERRAIGQLLAHRKDESARIKVEGLMHSIHLISVYETLSLMCELLGQRVAVINGSGNLPPDDLEEAMASIIYCSSRVEIEELTIIANQFAAKFGEKWARQHINNSLNRVNPRLVSKLRIEAPSFDSVLQLMTEIANEFSIEWTPDLIAIESGIQSNDPQQLGSIGGGYRREEFKVDDQSADSSHDQPNSQSSSQSSNQHSNAPNNQPSNQHINQSAPQNGLDDPFNPQKVKSFPEHPATPTNNAPVNQPVSHSAYQYPGTLDVLVLCARDLPDPNDSNADIIVRLTDPSTGLAWRSQAGTFVDQPNNQSHKQQVEWSHQHWPLAVLRPTSQLTVEVVAVSNSSSPSIKSSKDASLNEQVLGGIAIEAEQLRSSQGTWYQLYSARDHVSAGQILLAAQFMTLDSRVDKEKAQVYRHPGQSQSSPVNQPVHQANNQSSSQSSNQIPSIDVTPAKPVSFWNVPSEATPPPAYDSPTLGSIMNQSNNASNNAARTVQMSERRKSEGFTDPGTGTEGQSQEEGPDADLEARFRALGR